MQDEVSGVSGIFFAVKVKMIIITIFYRRYVMPAGDRTGPNGFGPRTGRGAGFCAGYSVPGYANPVAGRGYGGYGGYGRGRGGGGRGWRHNFYATGMPYWARGYQPAPAMPVYGYSGAQPEFSAEDEMKMLRDQAEFMQKEIAAVQNRIQELEGLASGRKE